MPGQSAPRTSDWLATLRPARDGAGPRIVLFAHAGSGPNALLPVFRWVPADVEVVGVVLPGRERRHRDPYVELLATPAAVADGILDDLRSLSPLPTVFFGHSLGAQLAMSVAAREPASCDRLVLSACPPWTPHRDDWALTDDEVLDIVATADAASREMLDNPSMRDHLLSLLRADLELGRRLACTATNLPLTPTVVGGADDELVSPDELSLLAKQCGVRDVVHFLPGGHFYLFEERNHADFQLVIGGVLETVKRAA